MTQKTAWFMLGRLREVAGQMESDGGPLEGSAEVDEAISAASARTCATGSWHEAGSVRKADRCRGAVQKGQGQGAGD
ncbi:MAG: hypothetical protein OXE94_11045 [Aestuariivita sp.]|nr:hypothetical protein [Aestuariivita sp.]